MDRSPLVETLQELERRLLRADVRANPAQLGALLHPLFVEVGADGRTWSREEEFAEFVDAPREYSVWSQDFSVEVAFEGVALVHYRTAHIDAAGSLSRFVMRTSLWLRTESGWRLRFHQGTPTEAFERHTP